MFTLEMLPARYGDCLWIEYGDADSPRRILIDGGKAGTFSSIQKKINSVKGNCVFELVVVTHIDCDHIDGIVILLEEPTANLVIKEIWFNGWDQISRRLGGTAGEYLSNGIKKLNIPWNKSFNKKAVMVPDNGSLPMIELEGGMMLQILSPTRAALDALEPVWEKECLKAGIVPGSSPKREKIKKDRRLGGGINVTQLASESFEEDTSIPNASSIAILAEYDGKSCLLAGDAHPTIIVNSIQRRLEKNKLVVDAFKMAHHGSKNNMSPELAKLIKTKRYLISTNGAIYQHPDPQSVARVLVQRSDANLIFNYPANDRTQGWNDAALQSEWNYKVSFPTKSGIGIKIDLMTDD